jgi:ATP-binding cassette subfamily B multidrug efflux pump
MLNRLYGWFERRVNATAAPTGGAPPATLAAFYWHFVGPHRALFASILATGFAVAIVDSLIPVFIGRLVSLMAESDRPAALSAGMPMLLTMAVVILVGRPLANFSDLLARNNAIASSPAWPRR